MNKRKNTDYISFKKTSVHTGAIAFVCMRSLNMCVIILVGEYCNVIKLIYKLKLNLLKMKWNIW